MAQPELVQVSSVLRSVPDWSLLATGSRLAAVVP
jgi:hypothetical protein